MYLNSFFAFKFSIIPAVLHRLGWFKGSVLLIAPRGEFGVGALGLKSVKKRLYLAFAPWLFERSGVYWHASTEDEARDIRGVLPKVRRVLVREDETALPPEPDPGRERTGDKLRLVFLGRIVPVKGLETLLRGLALVEHEVDLDVMGPAEDAAYARRCRDIAAALPPQVRVRFRGSMSHDAILEELGNYDVMVLPTRGENFGHVVAEGLSKSLPVFCSSHTPWSPFLHSGGGRVVSPNIPSEWARQLTEVAAFDRDRLQAMKVEAGNAYRRWRHKQESPSIFLLLDEARRADDSKGCE
ncbi:MULTISPECIES: glycosyltransferase [Microbacterium]|uniref:glycosyltransferase n=1 Tax=Microbacterium TaxID=33882 RepID=UPI0028E1E5E3|nr:MULTISPECIES: glycosyltransferase [Microbacterium]